MHDMAVTPLHRFMRHIPLIFHTLSLPYICGTVSWSREA